MKNNHLIVFNELYNQLLNYPRDTLWNTYLKTIVSEQLRKIEYSDEAFEPEKLSRQQIYAKAKNIDEKNVDSQTAKNAVKTTKLKSTLEAFINDQPDCKKAFIELGYKPIIVTSASGGGSKNKTLLWMDIQVIENEAVEHIDETALVNTDDDIESVDDISSITYERKATSNIKPSLFTKLFFKQGELKVLSVRGVSLMLLLMAVFVSDILIAIYAFLVLLLLDDLPTVSLWQAILFSAMIPFAYISWRYFFMPLYLLPYHRVIKAPMFFANVNVDNADIEMYRDKDRLNVARVTEFTATCPICSGTIILAQGKPDQKPPLVGRCKEAPHAHVYSFDRMTMKGCFLGVPNYLSDKL
ncbi:hypothetical protein J3492_09660 [Psychrobacter sp. F1192]|uniref:Uncharacterized protein n=1 Tax=Psychrobacter coccoides TaxID=2818440 RepID=A0ABS3NPW6_9GAMM|nr:hypothetical protein [Psychrobacter coccoides]MBO1531474.1 hypothetical protein [Psychrobacter coccoides]